MLRRSYYCATISRHDALRCAYNMIHGDDAVPYSTRCRGPAISERRIIGRRDGGGDGLLSHQGARLADYHPTRRRQQHQQRRHLSGGGGGVVRNEHTDGEEETAPFDRGVKWKQRTRAAESCRQYYNSYLQSEQQRGASAALTDRRRQQQADATTKVKPALPYDYFHVEVARRLVERLDDINVREEGFPLALEVGAGAEFVHDAIVYGCGADDDDGDMMLEPDGNDGDDNASVVGRGGVRKLVQMDSCPAMLHRDDAFSKGTGDATDGTNGPTNAAVCETYKLAADPDENAPLPFPDGTFDLVISSMAFHWVNDLPKLLSEVERVLKPDGCLLFALPGGNTLPELRSSLVLSELERTGGVSTHVGPYIDLSNIGSLLTGTGFRLPTIDIDDIQIGYPNAFVLMEHLARMGEGNACTSRRERVGLGTFLGAACLYGELYPAEEEGDEGGGVVATAQVIYGIAWKEHESQQRPSDRGSAAHKMTDISVTKTTGNSE